MAVIVRSNGTCKAMEPRDPARGFSLEELKEAIGGGWIEMVRLGPVRMIGAMVGDPDLIHQYPGAQLYLIVDEEGILKNLPFNPIATLLYHRTHSTRAPIMGDALLCVVTGKLNDNEMEVII